MEEVSDPITIPSWIWLVGALVVVGIVIVFFLKRDRSAGDNDRYITKSGRHHSSRRHRSSHGSSSRGGDGSSRSRRPRREGGTFDKY
jgi:hypothetical protein